MPPRRKPREETRSSGGLKAKTKRRQVRVDPPKDKVPEKPVGRHVQPAPPKQPSPTKKRDAAPYAKYGIRAS